MAQTAKQQDSNSKAAVVATIGAVVGATAAIALSKKKNRDVLKAKLGDAVTFVEDTLHDGKIKTEELTAIGTQKAKEAIIEAKNVEEKPKSTTAAKKK